MMKQKDPIVEKLKGLKPLLSSRYGVKRIGYFGSYARGDQVAESDVDILVEFEGPVGWEFFSLESFLEQELGLKVDLVKEEALKDRLKDDILEEVVYL
jgi:predicted nucleotidyltransferase